MKSLLLSTLLVMGSSSIIAGDCGGEIVESLPHVQKTTHLNYEVSLNTSNELTILNKETCVLERRIPIDLPQDKINKLKRIKIKGGVPHLIGKASGQGSRHGRTYLKVDEAILPKIKRLKATYEEVLKEMKWEPYDVNNLPVVPIDLLSIGKWGIDFIAGRRSEEILTEGLDYKLTPEKKPVHPMGIGFEGELKMKKTRFSGVFSGGNYPILVRASISQGNPFKFDEDNEQQKRSVAFGIKVFNDKKTPVVTANSVTQNDLNGELLDSYIAGVHTNHPGLDFMGIRYLYEVGTLVGIATGTLKNKADWIKGSIVPINPQYRPLHQLAEFNVKHPCDVNTPVWYKFQIKDSDIEVDIDDFRLELLEVSKLGKLEFDIFVSDSVANGVPVWEHAGEMKLNNAILSRGVDEKIRFHHDSRRSTFTGKPVDPLSLEETLAPKPTRELLLDENL